MLRRLILLFMIPLAFAQNHSDYRITLGGKTFDPLNLPPKTAKADTNPSYKQLQLVQLWGSPEQSHLQQIREMDLEIIQYIHPHTYVVWGPVSEAETNGKRDAFRYVGPFATEYRLLPRYRNQGRSLVPMRALIYKGRRNSEIESVLKTLKASRIKFSNFDKRFSLLEATIAGDKLEDVAALRGVYTVQIQPEGGARGELTSQLNASQVDIDGKAVIGYQAWLDGLGLSGDGQIVAVVDQGIDQTHADFTGRVLPCIGDSCEDQASVHGTHVAGILGGDGDSGTVDTNGFLKGMGVAPGVSILEQAFGALYTSPPGVYQLITESFRNGARISNNSWGTSSFPVGYDLDTLMTDIGVRDADPDLADNQAFTYVIAIENGGGTDNGNPTIGAPEEAKNLIRVGSTWAQDGNAAQVPNVDSISNNSAHGPGLDGRMIPDIVAPGNLVESTSNGGGYSFRGGTSMASPQVAGAAALFTEYYQSLLFNPLGEAPSPALIKAAILVVSKDLEGGTDANGGTLGHRPDSKQGWGRLLLNEVINPQTNVVYYDNPNTFLASEETWSATLNIDDPTKPTKVMLVWTDAPGHGLGGDTPAWNNNLDLEVDLDGTTYIGNVFDPATGWSTTPGSADIMNNVEAVMIGPTTADMPITLRVKATDINSDAIPGDANMLDQDFSIVCVNCTWNAEFELLSDTPTVNTCSPTPAVFNVALSQIGGFSDPVTLSTTGLPMGVTPTFDTNPISTGSTTLTLSDIDGLAAGDYPFTVVGNAGGDDVTLDLVLTVTLDPGAVPVQNLPYDNAIYVTTEPTLSWDVIDDALAYRLEIASDDAFSNLVYTSDQGLNSHQVSSPLDYATTYYWRVASTNVCGQGSFSDTRQFKTVIAPKFLLVDDDHSENSDFLAPDVRSSYTDALDNWGVEYDIWDVVAEGGEPTAADMAIYDNVLWFSGNAPFHNSTPYSGPNGSSEDEVATYLENGGNMAIFSQNYLQQMGAVLTPTTFMADYLDITGLTGRLTYGHIIGQSGLAYFDALGPFSYSPPFNENSGDILIGENGTVATGSSNGYTSSVMSQTANYRLILSNYSLAGLNSAAANEVIGAILNTFGLGLLNDRLADWPDPETVSTLITRLNEIYAESKK